MSYLKAVLNNNQDQEIKNLKILISTGKKLKKDVKKYEKELKKYNGTISKYEKPKKKIKNSPTNSVKTKKKEKPTTVKNSSKPKILNNIDKTKYTIQSVVDKDNMIIITFNTTISKNYVKFFEEKIKTGYRDIYHIKGSFKDAKPTKLNIKGVKIVIKQIKPNILRIFFEDTKNLKTVYFLNKNRLILKVLDNTQTTKNKNRARIIKSQKLINSNKKRTVVLDAGHGGNDVGAVGKNKKYEKIAVFKVTKYLESILKKRGYKVYLTRNSDKFIKVKNRTILANKKHADIFLSIHANAAPKSRVDEAKGIETFFLSPARSARAKRVAALENKSDIRSMSTSTKQVFLESLNRPRITASHKLCIDIQKNMLFSARKIYKDVVDGGVREGPFWVLVGAQMPSVLIELGYITHSIEGKRLYNTKYQKSLALGIANGIDSYFSKNP